MSYMHNAAWVIPMVSQLFRYHNLLSQNTVLLKTEVCVKHESFLKNFVLELCNNVLSAEMLVF